MPRRSQRKGQRIEREILRQLRDYGLTVERRSLSDQSADGGPDLIIEGHLTCEIKSRKDGGGFSLLNRWKSDNDLLILKQNNREALALVSFAFLAELLRAAEPMPRVTPSVYVQTPEGSGEIR